ncbi:M20/M25/M40 family metallo-hydrolase [Archangium violaceum]|uniref:M20/M25/M40 family metallo-hydrolase n=1 Tax=Archangium violaceum TaxID=83451 RepID=UPI001951437E|nr:M20/M25/M40 family metallo-hydrolase [Archangium violaceum]QRO00998.1 M20/M25/M40 family metallo-hydrolase [Archangium violaceum]
MDRRGVRLHSLALLSLLALLLAVTALRYRGPAPRDASAPADAFSSERALSVLRRILEGGEPHPVGSEAHARVRERILGELTRMGYAPTVQETFVCGGCGNCATVRNIVARLEGTEPGGAILLASHYDTAPTSPGASDDGAGVATMLEVARMLKGGPAPRHPVVILFSDGEEIGLLGARAFAASHPYAREIRVALNVEARGSSGPSMMFETSAGNENLVRLFTRRTAFPIANSTFTSIYQQMGNSTDLTPFVRAGMQGFNLGFIGDAEHYHTPLDRVEQLDPRSIQHHGDNVVALLRGLQEEALPVPAASDAVFFDVLGLTVFWWPGWLTLPLSLVTAVLFGLGAFRLRRAGVLGMKGFAWGLLARLVSLPLAVLLAVVVALPLRAMGVTDRPWLPAPQADALVFYVLGLFAAGLAASWLERRAGSWGLWLGAWSLMVLLALACALALPGASFLFVLPALAAALAMLLPGAPGQGPRGLVLLAPLAVALLLWVPMAWCLFLAVGLGPPALWSFIGALVLGLAAPLLAPLLQQRPARLAMAGAVALACVAAALSPPHSQETPNRLVLELHQDADAHKSHWAAFNEGVPLPPSLEAEKLFGGTLDRLYPWEPEGFLYLAEGPGVSLPAPELVVNEDMSTNGSRRMRVTATSSRRAGRLQLALPPESELKAVTVQGLELPKGRGGFDACLWGWNLIQIHEPPPEGVAITLELGATQPLKLFLRDVSPGLPAEGQRLGQARDREAISFEDGDVTVVTRQLKL